MRTLTFMIFFSIVLIIYSSVNYYVFSRGLMVFSYNPSLKRWYTVIFWTVVSSFLIGMFWERTASSIVSEWVYRVGADLHLSGHTHDGQMWPLNYLTNAIFELSWRLKQKGNTTFYVSSGFGSWGPPVRIGNTPEVVVFKIKFD